MPFIYVGRAFYGNTGGGDNYGSWLVYEPQEKLTVAYTTNAKIYPVAKIVSGVIDIYYNEPFQIPSFEGIAVSPEILAKYASPSQNCAVTGRRLGVSSAYCGPYRLSASATSSHRAITTARG